MEEAVEAEAERLTDSHAALPDGEGSSDDGLPDTESPPMDAPLTDSPGAEQLATGARVGDYEVVRHLGSGGMGSVYLAVRADRRYRKEVAIKILKRGLDSEEILRRFRQERQILASLDHPNVARLLDAATSDAGQPCFVMEYVEGTRIDRYCDDRRLSIRERLELFRTVCDAVQAAHRGLVVHRDLKPGNILVTTEGAPKLLDFGVAKLLDPDSFPQTVVPTALPYHPMTPDYASPEQVRGEAITTASDVYSLGVLLYRLLTGHRPYRVDLRRPAEMERVICEVEPEKPSATTSSSRDGTATSETRPRAEGSPEKLRRRLAGDLDTIVLKALAKEATHRYGSVFQLSEDLRRHLEGLPILARRPTFGYRAGKFLRRYRAGVAMACLSVALLLAGIATTTWQAQIARSERARAESEKAVAEEAVSFMETLFEIADPSQAKGETVTALEILEKGAERFAELEDQPQVQARLMDSIGRSYQGLGLYEEAARQLEEALETRRRVLGDDHLETAETLDNLAGLVFEAKGRLRARRPVFPRSLGNPPPAAGRPSSGGRRKPQQPGCDADPTG